jgi:hypothetical protein
MFPRDVDQQRELMYNEQVKTNALLMRLIEMNITETPKATVITPENRQQRKTRGQVR